MPAIIQTHPSTERLRAFSQGHVEVEALADISAHLDACPDCCTLLDQLSTQDALVARLQTAAQVGDHVLENEDQRRHAVRALQKRMASSLSHTMLGLVNLSSNNGQLSEPTHTSDRPRLPGYEILEELGRGGMGVVYKARHLDLNRLVALKMLHAGALADPATLARFHDEAKAVARLPHPGIVQIHEIGTLEGQPYLALEYIAGPSLAHVLQGTPQPPRDAAAFLIPLAEAIDAAHREGILHRDLKPANILLFNRAAEAHRDGQSSALNV